jgi:hypothetical protein
MRYIGSVIRSALDVGGFCLTPSSRSPVPRTVALNPTTSNHRSGDTLRSFYIPSSTPFSLFSSLLVKCCSKTSCILCRHDVLSS